MYTCCRKGHSALSQTNKEPPMPNPADVFKLRILVIDFFAKDLERLFAQFYPKVEIILPHDVPMDNIREFLDFVQDSYINVVFLEDASLDNYPIDRKKIIKACEGKIVYDTSLFPSLEVGKDVPVKFPRNSASACLFPGIFLYRDEAAKVLLFSFIHRLRHYVQIIEREKKG